MSLLLLFGQSAPGVVAPTAGFSYITTARSVAFTDTSTPGDGTINAWDWDFGDGSPHGTTQNPVHLYADVDDYDVVLTVTDTLTSTDDDTQTVSITNTDPIAAFVSSVNQKIVTFTDASTDDDLPIASWDWDFGDGGAHGTTQNPQHTYGSVSTFTVVLTVTDSDGATDAVSHDVTTLNAPSSTDAEQWVDRIIIRRSAVASGMIRKLRVLKGNDRRDP